MYHSRFLNVDLEKALRQENNYLFFFKLSPASYEIEIRQQREFSWRSLLVKSRKNKKTDEAF